MVSFLIQEACQAWICCSALGKIVLANLLECRDLCVHSKQGVFKEGPSTGVAPTLLHPRGVVPTLLQARIQQTPRANCPGRPCNMHCTMSRTCLDIKETKKFQYVG